MLSYDKSFDPLHTSLRMLRILEALPAEQHPTELVRILDFYLAFPHKISEIRVPRALLSLKKRFVRPANPYIFLGDSFFQFSRMKVIQETAFRLLSGRGLISVEVLAKGYATRTDVPLSEKLQNLIKELNEGQADLLGVLTDELAQIPLLGVGGLKDRTGLIDFRYDAV